MKKKSTSKSAFFNFRVLIGLFLTMAGVFLALLGLAAFSANAASSAQMQQKQKASTRSIDLSLLPPGFDCSTIHQKGIDKEDNLRAGMIMIACGLSEGGSDPDEHTSDTTAVSGLIKNLLPEPLFVGGSDVDVVLPDSTYPKVTQSESMGWGGPNNTWVVNYNDSRTSGGCYSGLSYSTDNGATWHASQPLCSGHGTNFGDPIVVYNARLNTWFAGDLSTGCGGQGIGLWTSANGVTWTIGACAHNGSQDDRESMWVDNNPASAFYGRMYISYNDFNVGGGALYVVYSDNGTAWTQVQLNPTFIRDVQVTGDLQGSGRVYVASMNEGAGGLTTRQNVMYRSTNGGVTWASSNAGPSFQGPGRATSGSFALVFSSIWRHMGWGQPAASGNVVSLTYAACGNPAGGVCSGQTDHGNIYYIRSTDAGLTWGTPVKLNTDSGTAMQWQPSLTTTQSGTIFASWYDQREVNGGSDLDCVVGSPNPCYRRWGRVSFDNGATWQSDDMVGRALSGLPAQPDSAVQAVYEGDYDYHSSFGNTAIGAWTDGRNTISSNSQQDVFVSLVQGASPTASPTPTATPTASPTPTNTPTPTPCVGQYIITQIAGTIVPGTTDIGNHTDDTVTTIALPFPFTLYDQSFTSINLSANGNAQFTTTDSAYTNQCLPWVTHNYTIFPYWDDLYLINSPSGIFTSISGTAPNRIFNIEWRAQYFPGTGTANFELRLYEGQTRFDIIYGGEDNGNTSATAGVQKDDTTFTQYFCNGVGGPAMGAQSYIALPCGVTPSPTPTATATFTPMPTATATAIATATATVPPSPTPTATATATSTATATATPTATPTCARLSAPSAQSATDITFNSFTAHWNSVAGAAGYRLDVSTSTSFATYVSGYQNLDVGNTTSFPVTGLNPNTTYYYRVRSYNACGTSSNSSVKNAKTLPCMPKTPNIQSAINVSFDSFTARWSSVAGATEYRLDVATDSSFINYVTGYQDLGVGNVTSFPMTGLTPNTLYYYRVRADNGCALSSNSSAKSVRTTPCTPAAPSVQNAANVTSSSFTARWNSVAGAVDYRLDVATDSSFINYVTGYQNLSVGDVTSYNVTGLSSNTIYYYRVRAFNGCAPSSNSSVKSVQTSR